MSALSQKRTLGHVRAMSALPPKADIGTQPPDVRFVPKADVNHESLNSARQYDHRDNCRQNAGARPLSTVIFSWAVIAFGASPNRLEAASSI